jgi:hypothetical protein
MENLGSLAAEKLMIFGPGKLQSNLYALVTSNQKLNLQSIQRKVASGASSENLQQPPSGGYPEWTNWGDFLGNVSHTEQQEKKDQIEFNSKLIAEFSLFDTAMAATYLKKLGLENMSKLRNMKRRYAQLRNRSDWIELRNMLASRIPKFKTTLETIEILIFEKCFYLADFLIRRDSNPNLQRIPRHPDRLGKGVFQLARKT